MRRSDFQMTIFALTAVFAFLFSVVVGAGNLTVDSCAAVDSFTLVNPRSRLDIGLIPDVINLGYYPAQASFNIRIFVKEFGCQQPVKSVRVKYTLNGTQIRNYCDRTLPFTVFGDSIPTGGNLSDVRYTTYKFPNVTIPGGINASVQVTPYFELGCNGTSRGIQKKQTFAIVNSTVTVIKAIDSTPELYNAVDRWLAGEKSSGSDLAALYGHPIGKWDVSKLTDFSSVFDACRRGCLVSGRNPAAETFNDDISSWNVSSATLMYKMFRRALKFNGNLSSWDVSNVKSMSEMFSFATSFNGDLSKWDVSKVMYMQSMFEGASSFNSNVSGWNVSGVNSMNSMFQRATSFNIDISMWPVTRVTHLFNMFRYATSFDQNLCPWGSRLFRRADVENFFLNSGCPNQNQPDLAAKPPGPLCYTCI